MEQKELGKDNKKKVTPLQCKPKCECTPTTSETTKPSAKNCLKPENNGPSVSGRDETRLSSVEKDEPFKNLNETVDKYPDKYEHISPAPLTEPEFSEYKSTQLEAVPITSRNSTPVNTFNNLSSQNVAEVIGQTNSIVIRDRENDFPSFLGGGNRAIKETKEFFNQLRQEPLFVSSTFIFLSYYMIHFILYCGFVYDCECFFF